MLNLALIATLGQYARADMSLNMDDLNMDALDDMNFNMDDLKGMMGEQDLNAMFAAMQDPTTEDSEYEKATPGADPVKGHVDLVLEKEEGEKKYPFQAETSRLMDIIVNSLYSNRDVFLRELISNAADALSKIRHERLLKGVTSDDQLAIYIEADKEAGTITITDNGIGMDDKDLTKNLGTIAHSGTAAFLEQLTDGSADLATIGQFGVGFYSAFLVADGVAVQSHKFGTDDEFVWKSQASDGFTISKAGPQMPVGQGTRIILQLKADAAKYARGNAIQKLVKEHSEFVDFPIFVKDKAEWKHMNPAKPIWHYREGEIDKDEYSKYYSKISKDRSPPIETIVFRGEGSEAEFMSVMFIPDNLQHAARDPSAQEETMKLYSRGVAVKREDPLLPTYLSFVRGAVESNDLPLKVDREQLSNSREYNLIQKRLTKRVVDSMAKIMKKEPEGRGTKLWELYQEHLLSGCIMEKSTAVKNKIQTMLRFSGISHAEEDMTFATYPSKKEELGDDYKPEEDPIFYYWGRGRRTDPILEQFKTAGYEVLLLKTATGEQCFMTNNQFEKRPLISVNSKEAEKFIENELDAEDVLAREKMYLPVMDAMGKSLKAAGYSAFHSVNLTYKLTKTPAAIFANDTGVTAIQEDHIRNLAWFDEKLHGHMIGGKVLSINPGHPIVKQLHAMVGEAESKEFSDGVAMLYEYALLLGGHRLENPDRMMKMIQGAMMKDLAVNEEASGFEMPAIPAEFYEEKQKEEEIPADDEGVEEEKPTDKKADDEDDFKGIYLNNLDAADELKEFDEKEDAPANDEL